MTRANWHPGRRSRGREFELKRLYSTFPPGWSGAGLLLLRVVVGFAAVAQGWTLFHGSEVPALIALAVAAPMACAGLALLIGIVTPIAAAIVGIGIVGLVASAQGTVANSMQSPVYLLSMSVAVVLLGPGALSLDARIFGRREIVIPDESRPKDGPS